MNHDVVIFVEAVEKLTVADGEWDLSERYVCICDATQKADWLSLVH